RLSSPLVLTMVLLLAVLAESPIRGALGTPLMQSWMTVFVAVTVQALPFLVLGVLLSAAIAVFVPPAFFARPLPRTPPPPCRAAPPWPCGWPGWRARCCRAASARRSRWRARWCAGV